MIFSVSFPQDGEQYTYEVRSNYADAEISIQHDLNALAGDGYHLLFSYIIKPPKFYKELGMPRGDFKPKLMMVFRKKLNENQKGEK